MASITYYFSIVASLAVLVVLVWGLLNLLRSDHANLSQLLMRWRIGLQLVAIIVIMAAVYFMKATV